MFRVVRGKDLPEGGRIHREFGNVSVTLLRFKGEVHCLDSTCFHMGGPLGDGDMEDVAGRAGGCIVCPWHRYKICLGTGKLVLKNLAGEVIESSEPRQRIHTTHEDADGWLWVTLSGTDMAGNNAMDEDKGCSCSTPTQQPTKLQAIEPGRPRNYGLGRLSTSVASAAPTRDDKSAKELPAEHPAQGLLDMRVRKVNPRMAAARAAVLKRNRMVQRTLDAQFAKQARKNEEMTHVQSTLSGMQIC